MDEAIAQEVLNAISGSAVEAALEAADQLRNHRQQQRRAIELQVEQARYEAQLAARRYDAVDPENRLVAAELECRWNAALEKARELGGKLQQFDAEIGSVPMPDKEVLMSLAQDLPAVWNASSSDMRLKQRIVRILIHEIVVDVNEKDHETVLLIHWAGGRHSETASEEESHRPPLSLHGFGSDRSDAANGGWAHGRTDRSYFLFLSGVCAG